MKSLKAPISLILFIFSLSALAEVPYESSIVWDGPQTTSAIASDLAGVQSSTVLGLEIGPSDSPVCADCDYLDTRDMLLDPKQSERLRIGRAQEMPYADQSYDLIILKNFPWLIESNIRRHGIDWVLEDTNKMRARNGMSAFEIADIKRIAAEQKKLRTEVMKECRRVLKSSGSIVLLFRGARDFPGEIEMFLSPLVEQATKLKMIVEEIPNIRDRTTPELASDFGGYGRPLSGLRIMIPGRCETQLLKQD